MRNAQRRRTQRQAALVFVSVILFLLAAACSSAAQKRPPAKPVDLNRATAEQLAQLPGIGPATAKAIVQFRQKSGPFERVEDLLAIHGVSKNKLEKLRPYVTLSPPPQHHSS
ncbi:MAG: ComEA family DNA-binding protein [Candidatus Acidiferrales bacterium]